VRFKAGAKTLALRRTSVIRSCRFGQRITFKDSRRFGRRRSLRVLVRFEGNARLLPSPTRTLSVRVR